MGDWYVRCAGCLKDDCCGLWHGVFKEKLVVTAGEDPDAARKCKEPCKCFVIVQDTDKIENPSKVLGEKFFSGEPGAKSLTIKEYDETYNGGKYRLVAACLKMKDGAPVSVTIPEGGKAISAAAKANQSAALAVVKVKNVIRDGKSNRYLVVLKRPK